MEEGIQESMKLLLLERSTNSMKQIYLCIAESQDYVYFLQKHSKNNLWTTQVGKKSQVLKVS